VELVAKKGAKIRYTTIQNWSKDVYNLVTKRAYAYENATVEWIDGNLGSKLTMKYPGVYMLGRNAHAEIVSVAFAGAGQHQDAGAKAVHLASNTTSRITSKSVSKDSGRTTYRGEDQIFYLMSRGFTESDALSLIVGGFMEPFTKELPMEYAVELNRLVKLEMEGSVG
jgi:Fe-S cluster assembly protein SufB